MSSLAVQRSSVPQVASSAPTTELGITNPYPLPSWAQFGSTRGGPFVDYLEYVPELRWPASVRSTFPRMANDTQLKALMRGTTMPIIRYRWAIDPNGADQALVDGISADLNLPLQDTEDGPQLRAQNRFSFRKHLIDALRSLEYGHYYFEQVGTITPISKGGDGLWHLRKLAARPPRTIGQIFVEQDGGLAEIKQYVGFWSPALPVGVLVAYVWDQEPGNWVGHSMYRACYREWLIKDRLLRVDAINHEKSGGQWWAEGAPNALQPELDRLGAQVAQIRVGEASAMAVPNGAKLHLESAGAESAIQSINRHDEAMARAFLMMFIQLGQTQHGSRALGDSFVDFADVFRQSIAAWFADVFNEHVIEDWVDWNYGPQVQLVPRVVFQTEAQQGAQPEGDLFDGAKVDPATQAALRGAPAWKVGQLRAQYDREQRAFMRRTQRLLPALLEATAEEIVDPVTGDVIATREQVVEAQLAELGDVDARDEEVHDRLLAAIATSSRASRRAARASAVGVPARTLRRAPSDVEAAAKTDFAQLDREWDTQTTTLVQQWQAVRAQQVAQLQQAITDAEGELATLATLAATPAGGTLIESALKTMAQLGAAQAVAEASRQGATATVPSLTHLDAELEARAAALEQLLAQSISQAASTKAVQLTGGALEPAAVSTQVGDYLAGLSDAYLRDQLGGALSAAQNAGRLAAMDHNQATRFYASELLDTNTCEPCEEIDGTEYATAEAAAVDYPAGGYRDCQGGPRCRGTVVAIYDESEASA